MVGEVLYVGDREGTGPVYVGDGERTGGSRVSLAPILIPFNV